VERNQTPCGRNAAAFSKDYSRDDLSVQVEMMQGNDLSRTPPFQFWTKVVNQKYITGTHFLQQKNAL